jgi:GNAT superfamily N-acetyltransferase
MTIEIALATGAAIEPHLDALARLRIAVFREYPYLYDGSMEYEQQYLACYARSTASLAVLALDGGRVVGAATALPLTQHSEDLAPPLARAGIEPGSVYYFAESVLEPGSRGRGIGSAFFVERERRARELGFRVAAFCAVDRPTDHPRRPAGYVAPGALWRRHGFVRRPDIVGELAWQDVDDVEETTKPMVFWLKELA